MNSNNIGQDNTSLLALLSKNVFLYFYHSSKNHKELVEKENYVIVFLIANQLKNIRNNILVNVFNLV